MDRREHTQSASDEQLLTTGQAAGMLNIAPGTLQNWRTQGIGPQFLKHRRSVYYAMSELMRYKRKHFMAFASTQEWKETL